MLDLSCRSIDAKNQHRGNRTRLRAFVTSLGNRQALFVGENSVNDAFGICKKNAQKLRRLD
jgi:hypothetical protein